jgi:hypothetical protein
VRGKAPTRVCESREAGRSRGRFATPADSPRQDRSPCRELHVRRESLGVVHRSRAMCRTVPNLALRFATVFETREETHRGQQARHLLDEGGAQALHLLVAQHFGSVGVGNGQRHEVHHPREHLVRALLAEREGTKWIGK